jgi:TonB family protein
MLYLMAVSIVMSVAAWLAEEGLRRAGVPTRWLWLFALAAPLSLLAAARLLPEQATAVVVGGVPSAGVIELPDFLIGAAADPVGLGWPDALRAAWLFASLAMATVVIRAHVRLRAERRTWVRQEVDGRAVFVSPDRGPAAAGIVRPWIVIPKWILELPERQRTLVVLHESEHVSGGDTVLLPLGLALVCASPWNPIAWWQLARMRTAMEVDCDRRVLLRRPEPAIYGDSLLVVAARATDTGLALAAFSERRGSLHRRIVAMTQVRTPWSSFRAVLFTLAACAMAVQACGVEGPVAMDESGIQLVDAPESSIEGAASDRARSDGEESSERDPREQLVPDPAFDPDTVQPLTGEALRAEPAFTPFTVAPSITNRNEVIQAMTDSYPPLLRDAGVGGTVRVYFFINKEGVVEQVRLDDSSGHAALDDAALNVAGAYRFTPAQHFDEPVPAWVSFPITFQVR